MSTDGKRDETRYDGFTETIIGCAFKVGSKLGCGFLEKCYENALVHELRKAGLKVEQQVELQLRHEGVIVGVYVADLIVEDVVLVEPKAISGLEPIHSAICINYLAATGLPICLLINFRQTSRHQAHRRPNTLNDFVFIGVHRCPIGG